MKKLTKLLLLVAVLVLMCFAMSICTITQMSRFATKRRTLVSQFRIMAVLSRIKKWLIIYIIRRNSYGSR